jgi:hypothetical protein
MQDDNFSTFARKVSEKNIPKTSLANKLFSMKDKFVKLKNFEGNFS